MLSALLEDIARVRDVPADAGSTLLEQVLAQRARIAAEDARLEALEIALAARIGAAEGRDVDRLLKVAEAEDRTGFTEDWLYRNARRLPFTRRPSAGQVRFSSKGIDDWIAAGCPLDGPGVGSKASASRRQRRRPPLRAGSETHGPSSAKGSKGGTDDEQH